MGGVWHGDEVHVKGVGEAEVGVVAVAPDVAVDDEEGVAGHVLQGLGDAATAF